MQNRALDEGMHIRLKVNVRVKVFVKNDFCLGVFDEQKYKMCCQILHRLGISHIIYGYSVRSL